ncbi:MAG TPA: hypothetical protein VGQ11_13810 [Candidatus Acidoferrales bacterium]|nr:hypothetical protein [Candidatus Acidoferrales bacterium]
MKRIDRREFLSGLTGSLLAASVPGALPLLQEPYAKPPLGAQKPAQVVPAGMACWLDIAAPFVVEDPRLDLNTQLVLTATCFPGVEGFRDPKNATDYQILLYDAQGREIKLDNDGRLTIPALHTTLVQMNEMARKKSFWGGAKIRVAPSAHQVARAGDLFSAGFVRWTTSKNFDNVHAHPAPPQQVKGQFNYSMPFPSLEEYHCAFALFNPNEEESAGTIRVVDRMARTVVERPYQLAPHQTFLYTLADLKTMASPGEALAMRALNEKRLADGGVIVVRNDSERVPFAYTFMKGRTGESFSVEHPLHFQADVPVKPARATPYGPNKSFPASALLYTPMLFSGKRIGDLELESRFYLSASRWLEEALWLMPFVTDGNGNFLWASNQDDQFAARVQPAALISQGVLRLEQFQSCRIDAKTLPLPEKFSGGFGVATIPKTSHSLLKVEVRAVNWGRVAFTHFRPGGKSAESYRLADDRGGVATDYIVTDCQVQGPREKRKRDALLAVMNIEFEEKHTGSPRIQLFGPSGLIAEKSLGEFAPLACRHFVLSELFPGVETETGRPCTVRLLDGNAIMIVSALHVDYERRDIALEHGSDRHSTYQDFKC